MVSSPPVSQSTGGASSPGRSGSTRSYWRSCRKRCCPAGRHDRGRTRRVVATRSSRPRGLTSRRSPRPTGATVTAGPPSRRRSRTDRPRRSSAAEDHRTDDQDHQPGQYPDPQHGQGGAVGLDQLQPGEAQQSDRRPARRRAGEGSSSRPGSGSIRASRHRPRWTVRSGLVARQNGPQDQRQRDQADPHPDEDEAEDRVGQPIRPGDQGQADPGEQGQHQQPRGESDRRGRSTTASGSGGPDASVGERGSRLAPREQQDDERDRQRQRRADQDEQNGSGRSCREAMPCRGITGDPRHQPSADVQDHDDLLEVMRLHLEAAGRGDRTGRWSARRPFTSSS